jgi:integrase
MGRKKLPGLVKREGVWHIDKRLGGQRVCRSTETDQLDEAERVLARLIEVGRQARIFGVRPSRTFEQAAAKYVIENRHKRSLKDDIGRLNGLMRAIGQIALDKLHMGALQPWIESRKAAGTSPATINHGLQIVRRILNLASGEWMDENGLTWLLAAPKIKLLPNPNKRKPYPLSWDEQHRLFQELPEHLKPMALFAVNTGCRDKEVCSLEWEWEIAVPALNASVFIIPEELVKNGEERLVVLNDIAKGVIGERRGKHPTHVFTYQGEPIKRMLNWAWLKARARADLPLARVHDLKHTFGRRLRAAGVSFEDRQDLLGHRSGRITTHYSAAELSRLIEAANKVCLAQAMPELVVLRGTIQDRSRKTPARPSGHGRSLCLTH